MDCRILIDFLGKIEKLKCNTRHCFTTTGRPESVAEHSWRLAVLAMLVADEYPDTDMDKVIKMCLVHDFGEAVTGDIPAFWKTESHEATEKEAVKELLSPLPEKTRNGLSELFDEMEARQTPEAKLWKALDNIEAVIAHNESDISTWIPNEYHDNLVYGEENCRFSITPVSCVRFSRRTASKKLKKRERNDQILCCDCP